MKTRLRVLFIVRQLGRGGAERQLLELLKSLDKKTFDIHLASLYSGGALWQEACSIPGVCLVHFAKKGRWHFTSLLRLAEYIRRVRPHVVHGYTGVPNLLSLIGKCFGSRAVWGVRSSYMDLTRYDYLSRMVYRAEARLSRFADLIICNSYAGRTLLEKRGFPSDRTMVIENGIDTVRFRPDKRAGESIRTQWLVSSKHILIGLVARVDPMKGHAIFIEAAGLVKARHERARFVMVGGGSAAHCDALRKLALTCGLQDKLIWAGERPDIPAVLSALDLAVSASIGEGFSNVIGECMACGVPCIVTDVGDSARIIGKLGWLVPPGNARALAESICSAIEAHYLDSAVGEATRLHIQRQFSTERLAERTGAALLALVEGSSAGGTRI